MNKKKWTKKSTIRIKQRKKRLSSPVMMMIICLQTFEYSNRNFIRIAHAMIRFDSFFQLKKRRRMRRILKKESNEFIRNVNWCANWFEFCFIFCIFVLFFRYLFQFRQMYWSIDTDEFVFFSSKYIKSLVFSVLNFQLQTNNKWKTNKQSKQTTAFLPISIYPTDQ